MPDLDFDQDGFRRHPADYEGTRRVLLDLEWERARQDKLGYTTQHDDEHTIVDLLGSSTLHIQLSGRNALSRGWDRKELVQAASLLVAVIEKLDREKVRNRE